MCSGKVRQAGKAWWALPACRILGACLFPHFWGMDRHTKLAVTASKLTQASRLHLCQQDRHLHSRHGQHRSGAAGSTCIEIPRPRHVSIKGLHARLTCNPPSIPGWHPPLTCISRCIASMGSPPSSSRTCTASPSAMAACSARRMRCMGEGPAAGPAAAPALTPLDGPPAEGSAAAGMPPRWRSVSSCRP